MDEDTFLAEVGSRLDLSKERAAEVTSAVLRLLRERIGAEAAHLDAQLPGGLKGLWHEPGAKEEVVRLHKDEFFRLVATTGNVTEGDAPRAVRVVFKVLQKALRSPTGEEGEAWDVFSRLPKDLKKVWTAAARLSDTPPKRKEVVT